MFKEQRNLRLQLRLFEAGSEIFRRRSPLDFLGLFIIQASEKQERFRTV